MRSSPPRRAALCLCLRSSRVVSRSEVSSRLSTFNIASPSVILDARWVVASTGDDPHGTCPAQETRAKPSPRTKPLGPKARAAQAA